jgi:hypothetical protein
MSNTRTTYARAGGGYDSEHEAELYKAILHAITEASRVSDCDVIVIRTGETTAALVNILALVLALSPEAVSSPASVRRTVEEIGKRLHRRVIAAQSDAGVRDFLRHVFHGSNVVGNA